MSTVKGYFVQYKFIFPDSIKHSSYTYQKLFRAIYGYTQVVFKSSGKRYRYHRQGVLSEVPYIRSGKNCVIIPQAALQKLTTFFRTGINPTHKWHVKGNWKAVYYVGEKELNPTTVKDSLEKQLDRLYLSEGKSVFNELKRCEVGEVSESYAKHLLSEAEKIIKQPWFVVVYSSSQNLKDFKTLYSKILTKYP
ncbi:MAG: hypothetical protein AABW72_01515 [archaeon]